MAEYVPLHRKGNTVVEINGRRVSWGTTTPGFRLRPEDEASVKLYKTVVARYDRGLLTVDTGGYNTVTTRARVNQFMRDYMDGEFGVRVRRGQLYLVPRGFEVGIPFNQTITVDTRPDP